METIESLRSQIDSAQDLHSVVKTMKGIAAVSIRQYERAVESLRVYSDVVELGFHMLVKQQTEVLSAVRNEEDGTLAAIVFGSDQGMCGSFNRDIAEHTFEYLKQEAIPSRDRFFVPIGMRAFSELEETGENVEAPHSLPHAVEGLTTAVQNVLVNVEQWREERGVSRVVLFNNRPRHGASYEPHALQLLPLSREWLKELAVRPWPTNQLPDHPGDWQTLFATLLRQYLFVALFRAFAESLASENASRLAAMQAAENNIEEKIDDLNARYHRRRQAAITEELLDVISGFEALETD
ncbi:MAG: F0F1 ATP synthase subunit gamma [Candidatus Hydrogenedentota bacterium]